MVKAGAEPLCYRTRATNGDIRFLMFGSNDYLGLAGDPDVVRGAIAAMERYGLRDEPTARDDAASWCVA